MHRRQGAPLIPWPNRLADGRYTFDGELLQSPLTEPAKQNAIHGLVRWMNWQALRHDDRSVVMGLRLHPQPGYPFTLDLTIEFWLASEGLTVRTTARNVGSRALPYGAGHHPYLTVGTERIDSAFVRIPAHSILEVDQRQIPTGRVIPVEGTEYDFRVLRRIGGTRLDTAYGDLIQDPDGRTRIEMANPDRTRQVRLWMDSAYQYVMIFTGDAVGEVARRRRGLGIEPMTCAPNAFQSGTGLRILNPGDALMSAWGISTSSGG